MASDTAEASGEHDAEGSFFFISGALALDLVNTDAAARGRPLELLPDVAAFAAWWDEARRHYPEADLQPLPPAADEVRLLAAVKRLRTAMRGLFEAAAAGLAISGDDLHVLNAALVSGREMVDLDLCGAPRVNVRSDGDAIAGVLLPLARAAACLLAGSATSRLHRCANGRCMLLFLDTTKSGTRRWCSTGCMNRWRSSQRYRQRKAMAGAAAGRGAAP